MEAQARVQALNARIESLQARIDALMMKNSSTVAFSTESSKKNPAVTKSEQMKSPQIKSDQVGKTEKCESSESLPQDSKGKKVTTAQKRAPTAKINSTVPEITYPVLEHQYNHDQFIPQVSPIFLSF